MKDREAVRNLPDRDIIILVNQGDTDAFKHLVDRYRDRIAVIAIGMLGYGQNEEDLGQEIFIRAFRSLKNFRFESEFSTYLVRIAINVCRDEIRKRKKQSHVPLEEKEYKIPGGTTGQADYEIRDAVSRALLELDSDQRIVVILRLIEGYSTRETARMLEVPEGTVLSRLSRAQKKLQVILNHLLQK